jgi:hypothetical protein
MSLETSKAKTDYQAIALTLKNIVGGNNVLIESVDRALYACDGEMLDLASPDLVVLPANTEEVQAVVKIARQHRVPFTARGAGTGLSGGATTVCGGISLVLSRMTKIIKVAAEDQTALVETGVTNSAVSQAAAKFNLCFAPELVVISLRMPAAHILLSMAPQPIMCLALRLFYLTARSPHLVTAICAASVLIGLAY